MTVSRESGKGAIIRRLFELGQEARVEMGRADAVGDRHSYAFHQGRLAAYGRAQEIVEEQHDKELHRCEHCNGDIRHCSTQCSDECGDLDCRYVWMAYGWRIKHGLLNVVPNEACDALAVMLREAEEKADG